MQVRKTQLICFYASSVRPITPTIYLSGTKLSYSDKVVHLGHLFTSTLDDTEDVMRAVKDINRKANSLLCSFHFVDPLHFCFNAIVYPYMVAVFGHSMLHQLVFLKWP